tara:strand:+ start:845 stop:1051 length:207 start_codon:yes stop_codon:yes gene_type:complete
MEKRVVKIKSTEGLAPNIVEHLKGKLFIVSEVIHSEQLHYIVENSKGIKCQVPSNQCEFKTTKLKKNK